MTAPASASLAWLQLERRPRWDYALVPDGVYDARVLDAKTFVYFRQSPKLVLTWSLCSPGYVGTIVCGFYAVPGLIGRVGRNGRYHAVGRGSHLARDLAAMLDTRPSVLGGPFPMEVVADRLYCIEVKSVTHDKEQRELPAGARYSRVVRVIGDAR